MRSGHVDLPVTTGRLGLAGLDGYSWSSRAASNIWGYAGFGAYRLAFNATETYPSAGPDDRWDAFPLRELGSGWGNQPIDEMGHWMVICYLSVKQDSTYWAWLYQMSALTK